MRRTIASRSPSWSPRAEWTRRRFLGAALACGGSAAAAALACGRGRDAFGTSALAGRSADAAAVFRWRPFSQELPIPRDAQPVAPFDLDESARLDYVKDWRDRPDLYDARYFDLTMKPGLAEIIPGVETPIWGYDGLYPGPTIRAREPFKGRREIVFVRFRNQLPEHTPTVIHLHGGHMPAESDGYTEDTFHPGEFRDHAYPMLPAGDDPGEGESFLWYHDHAVDETSFNVYQGLAGLFLIQDDDEGDLVDRKVLPAPAQELPLVLQDRSFNADGTLFLDASNHDGFLGDVQIVNGKVQPYVRVQRRKYRLRILNGSSARMYDLRLSSGRFVQVGADSALLPTAVARRSVFVAMAERADVVVDFGAVTANEVFLENWVDQDDGRGPSGTRERPGIADRGVPLLKFVLEGSPVPHDVTIDAGQPLKPHLAIDGSDPRIVTRRFEFDRSNGAWTINGRLFDGERVDATPKLGSTERWVLVNKSGGWWHPIHIHLELFQIVRHGGRPPPPWEQGPKDTVLLGPNDSAEVLMKFRDWPGRWVFHCHNIEHEDMRMMARFDVVR